MTPKELAARMRAEREAGELTQKAVARRMGVVTQTVRNWECGARTPSVFMLERYLRTVRGTITLGGRT